MELTRIFKAGLGTHNLIVEEEEFERWFYRRRQHRVTIEVVVEPIPETWRALF